MNDPETRSIAMLRTKAIVCLAVLSAHFPNRLHAESIEDYQHSTWSTVYETEDGVTIRSSVQLQGKSGRFAIETSGRDTTGSLSQIKYVANQRHHLGPPTPSIVGQWSLGGRRGYFVFRMPDNNGQMDGYWGFYTNGNRASPVMGSWDGVLLHVLPAPQEPAESSREELAGELQTSDRQKLQELSEKHEGPKPVDIPRIEPAEDRDEQITGLSLDILPISFLREGVEHATAVGRVVMAKDARPVINGRPRLHRKDMPMGTCFMVSESMAITASHVYHDLSDLPSHTEIRFDTGSRELVMPVLDTVAMLPELDVALVRVQPKPGANVIRLSLSQALDDAGNLLIDADEGLTTLHYPAGFSGLQITVHNSNFAGNAKERGLIYYTTDTYPGSSGAPVFNTSWAVVAVHLGADPGNRERNRGRRIDVVVRELRKALGSSEDGMKTLGELGFAER